jgi:polysaccharide pyruvyl transferase WcaK-like protein
MKHELGHLPEDVRIGIFGHYGNTNMGDEATIQAVIQNIRQRLPKASIICFSSRPDDTARRHQVAAFPICRTVFASFPAGGMCASEERISRDENVLSLARCKQVIKDIPLLYGLLRHLKRLVVNLMQVAPEIRFVRRSLKVLKDIDVLVVTGSNQFVDNFGGPWGFPYDLFKWSILAKLADAKVYYVSVGAGPISSRLSHAFIRWALKFSDYLSFRDEASKRLIEKAGHHGTMHVYPDLAHSLDLSIPELKNGAGPLSGSHRPVIGINPMPLYDSRYWCEEDSQTYNSFIQKLAAFSSRLLLEGYPVFFFTTQRKDEDVIDDILSLLDRDMSGRIALAEVKRKSPSVDDCMANILSADIVVAARFHGVALSLRAERPVVAICYYRKTRDLMREMGQEAYALDFENLSPDDLWKCLESLEKNRNNELERIREKGRAYRLSLDEQYDRLFGPLG